MDFDFTPEQLSLREAVARWVQKGFPFDRRHAIARAGGATRAVYTELAGLGLAEPCNGFWYGKPGLDQIAA